MSDSEPTTRDGLPDFAPRFDTDLVKPYWESLARGELSLPCCSVCGAWQWYPFEFVKCHPEAHHEWKRVAATGRIFTFAKVARPFLPNADPKAPPYTAALVEIDGVPGVRIPALLVNFEGRTPRIGGRVRLHPLRRSTYTAPAFEPDE
jgi:uncharacterized OB-fold protein